MAGAPTPWTQAGMPARAGEAEAENEPERKLLEAILQDAIECWQRCALVAHNWRLSIHNPMGRRQRDYREADFWLFGDYDNEPYFSFAKICDCLGLVPDDIRRRLLEWKQKK